MSIYVHADANGNRGVGEARMFDMLNTAIDQFRRESGGTIELYIDAIRVIDNSPHFILGSESEEATMFANYENWNALNVHFVNNGPNAGSANGTGGSPYVWVRNTATMETLTHEIGHAFGLLHTHENRFSFNNSNGDASNCYQEPVSRTMTQGIGCVFGAGKRKCAQNGDRLCDTAGDPLQNGCVTQGTCEYQNNQAGCDDVDNWGVEWTPPTSNIMSLSFRLPNRLECREDFSLGQIGVMINTLETSTYNFTRSSGSFSISGPSQVCPGASYIYSTNNGSNNLTWGVGGNLTVTSTSGNQASVLMPNSPNGEEKFIYLTVVPSTQIVSNAPFSIIASLPDNSVEPLAISINDLVANISGPTEINEGSHCHNFSTESHSGASYNWTITPILDPSSSPLTPTPYFCSGQTSRTPRIAAPVGSPDFYLLATINSVCGSTLYASRIISTEYDGPIIAPPGGGLNSTSGTALAVYPNPGNGSQLMLRTTQEESREARVTVIRASTGEEVLKLEKAVWNENLLTHKQLVPGLYIIRHEQSDYVRTFKYLVK